MSDRLAELLHQKKLLQEHLNWLDLEIARTAATTTTRPPTNPAPLSPPLAKATATTATQAEPSPTESSRTTEAQRKADEIIDRYKNEEASGPDDAKRGCLTLAAGLFVLLGIAFFLSYWLFYRSQS